MKKDWTETMRDKLSESTATPPDDLWASISSDLDAAMEVQRPRRKSRVLWWAAAACLAALIISVTYFRIFNERSAMPGVGMAINDIHVRPQVHNNKKGCDHEKTDRQTTNARSSIFTCKDALAQAKENQFNDIKTENTYIHTDYSEKQEGTVDLVDKTSIADGSEASESSEPDYESLLIAQAQEHNVLDTPLDNHRRISISLFASNPQMTGLSNSDDISYNDVLCSPGDYTTSDTNTTGDTSQRSRATETNTLKEAQHKQPLRVGLSARIPLSDILSVSAGVTYSRLSSTLTWNSDLRGTYDKEQTLHYIGVPVSIDYKLPSINVVGFYLTGGAMVEKCIYGESQDTKTRLSERISEKRLQMSLFAGAGVQLNITDRIGLYAEPLATYYFDNHSDVINIYKDRPFNLDLRIGLRYTLK